tara:strand:+ start:3179 stop:3559 length:381 start_codon:yes stop_codon:yes gene_type:complete
MRIKDIVKEGTFDDFDMKDYGKDLDNDEKDIGKGFEREPMFDQLGKILDTRQGDDPLKHVMTDDGEKVEVNPMQAQELRKLLRYEGMKPQIKLRFTKDLQMAKNLHDFVDSKDYKQIGAVFMQKYM